MQAGRVIKFRGKRADNGEWVYGLPAFNRDCSGIDKIEVPALSGGVCTLVDPETVGQFTGLLDLNGKEIYEGDILQAELYPIGPNDEYVAVVECADASFVATKYLKANSTKRGISHGMSESIGDRGEVEIIGNIYENKELLKAI